MARNVSGDTVDSPFPPGVGNLFHMVVWPHGMKNHSEILETLFSSQSLEVLHIKTTSAKNLSRLVATVYQHDYAPIEHLAGKLRYLKQAEFKKGQVSHIFFTCRNPGFTLSGDEPFRHLNSPEVNEIKWGIRESFNPRRQGEMTHDHVIHVSDNPFQAIHMARHLGFQFSLNERKPFTKMVCGLEMPHHIGTPKSVLLQTVAISRLRASILIDRQRNALVPVAETPHFKALTGGTGRRAIYDRYLQGRRGREFTDGHHWSRLQSLHRLLIEDRKAEIPPLLTAKLHDGVAQILDGVHRASAALAAGHEDIRVGVLEY